MDLNLNIWKKVFIVILIEIVIIFAIFISYRFLNDNLKSDLLGAFILTIIAPFIINILFALTWKETNIKNRIFYGFISSLVIWPLVVLVCIKIGRELGMLLYY